MRTIYYYYNSQGMLCLHYRDKNDGYLHMDYLYYSFRDALQKFRKDFGLQYKHIRIIKINNRRF